MQRRQAIRTLERRSVKFVASDLGALFGWRFLCDVAGDKMLPAHWTLARPRGLLFVYLRPDVILRGLVDWGLSTKM